MIQLKMKALQSLLEKNAEEALDDEDLAIVAAKKVSRKLKKKSSKKPQLSHVSDDDDEEFGENCLANNKFKRKLASKVKRNKQSE